MQQFLVGGVKDTEKTIESVPDHEETETAPICVAWECLRPHAARQGTVGSKAMGTRVRMGPKTARDANSNALRVRSSAEAVLRAGVGVFEIDL